MRRQDTRREVVPPASTRAAAGFGAEESGGTNRDVDALRASAPSTTERIVDEPDISAALKRPLVYLASPFALPDPTTNLVRTVMIADNLLATGLVIPYVPHLTAFWERRSQRTKDEWYTYGFALLSRCDALFRVAGESYGADREVRAATELNLPVFFSVEALVEWARVDSQ
jgi:hypothetical protein